MTRRLWIFIMVAFAAASDSAERPKGPSLFAITGARVVTGNGETIEGGTIVLFDGIIASVGRSADVPDGAWIIDGTGKVVYPGLVDALSDVGLSSDEKKEEHFARGPEDRPGTTSWAAAADELTIDDERIEKWRNGGFTSAVTSPAGGIISGRRPARDTDRDQARSHRRRADEPR